MSKFAAVGTRQPRLRLDPGLKMRVLTNKAVLFHVLASFLFRPK